MSITQQLKAQAKVEGFSSIGICHPTDIPLAPARLAEFLGDGRHGQMSWMQDRKTWRSDPSALWPDAKSIVMLTELYSPTADPLENLDHRDSGTISVYAQNRDYHDVVKKRLKRLARWLVARSDGAEVKVFVDTAPVMEKPLAAAAGLGWQGKHTNLVSRELGNWFFLGSIFTTLELDTDKAEIDRCGTCRACLEICPTDAFPAPYQLDARRCISYLTIEFRGSVTPELRKKMGNRIYGCDDCLAVCPWNKFAETAQETKYHAREDLKRPALAELVHLDDRSFREKFSGSPIKRIGRDRFVRNVLYAIGNAESQDLVPHAQSLCEDSDPVVAEAARWAVEQLREVS
ncbi:MAG: tRNA epoxyqueuosine(34) reductase QueG [Pseudomonadota bacterium]